MNLYLSQLLQVNGYGLLSLLLFFFAVASLWLVPYKRRWLSFLLWGLAMASGYRADLFTPEALLPLAIIFFVGAVKSYFKLPFIFQSVLHIFLIFVAGGILLNWIPEFQRLRLYPLDSAAPLPITQGAVPFAVGISLGKWSVGFLITAFFIPLATSRATWLYALTAVIKILPLCVAILAGTAYLINYIDYLPKQPPFYPAWIFANLFYTSFSEEAFFRGFIQEQLSRIFDRYSNGWIIPIVLTAILFGFGHYEGGGGLIFLSSIAGLFYGYAYYKGGFEAAVLTHFGLNAVHFFLFTYPAIA